MSDLSELALATACFVAGHFIMSHPARRRLVHALGEKGFLGFYSLVVLAAFAWMIWAAIRAPAEPLFWVASPGAWDMATLIMLFACVLLVGSLRGNPAAVNPTGRVHIPDQARGVYAISRHPMMWAFMLWAAVHIMLWGSAANLIISSGILVLALFGSLAQDAKKRMLLGPDWIEWRDKTAYIPFAAQLRGRLGWRSVWPGGFALIGGTLLWLAATWAHAPAGGPAVGIWRWFG